jgi:hypothetical protein
MQLLCEAVAQQLDGSLPLGKAWHRDLIEQMTLDLACGVGSLLRYLSETKVSTAHCHGAVSARRTAQTRSL